MPKPFNPKTICHSPEIRRLEPPVDDVRVEGFARACIYARWQIMALHDVPQVWTFDALASRVERVLRDCQCDPDLVDMGVVPIILRSCSSS